MDRDVNPDVMVKVSAEMQALIIGVRNQLNRRIKALNGLMANEAEESGLIGMTIEAHQESPDDITNGIQSS